MKKKDKKKSPQQVKQEEIHQKHCYLKQIKAMMGILGSESAYELLSPKGVELLFFLRLRPVKIISPKDPSLKVPRCNLDILNNTLSQWLRELFVSLGPEKKQVSLSDFFIYTETLHMVWRNINSDESLYPESLKDKLPVFASEDYQTVRQEAFDMLDKRLALLSWIFSNTTHFIIRIEMESREESSSPLDRSAFYNNYIAYFDKYETELIEIDGHKRTVYRLGFFQSQTLVWLTLTPEQLGLPGTMQQLPLKIYIQTHAMERLKERIGDYFMGLNNIGILTAILTNKALPSGDGGFLFPYTYVETKLGYLKASVIGDKLIIRTFLFVTNNGTPEGKKLAALLGVQKEDKKYLGIDKLSTFINSDIEANEHLKRIFSQVGCDSLFEMKKYLDCKPDHLMQCADYLAHYLGLAKEEEVVAD